MQKSPAIIDAIIERPEMYQQLVSETSREIPGSVHYSMRRFVKPGDWMQEDTGMLQYYYESSGSERNFLELRFCVTGQVYCREHVDNCKKCKVHESSNCHEKLESINVLSFVFTSTVLSQFIKRASTDTLADDVLAFKHVSSFSKTLPICNKTRSVLEGLLNNNYTDTLENIYVNAQTQMLLLYGLDCMLGEKEIDTITCKFLANEADRDKVARAREILIQHIGEPITIK